MRIRQTLRGISVLVAMWALMITAPPHAIAAPTVVFFDDFSGDPTPGPGVPAITVTDLAEWTVGPAGANVDLLNPVACAPGGSTCVGMDGTASPSSAEIETKATFDVFAGETYNLSFIIPVVSEPDSLQVQFGSHVATIASPTVGSFSFDFTIGISEAGIRLSFANLAPPNNIGPGLDDITLTRTQAVPEPSGLMLLGSGLLVPATLSVVRRFAARG